MRDSRDLSALFCGQCAHPVVKTVDQDLAVGRTHRRDDLGKGVDRVIDRPAIHARMDIDIGSAHVDLQRGQATQPHG